MGTLISLFTGTLKPTDNDFEIESVSVKKAHFQFWNEVLSPFNEPGKTEIAIFLPGLLNTSDEFRPDFRRFSTLGLEKEDQVRNVFELGFEKGFDRVIFISPNWTSATQQFLKSAIDALDHNKMIFISDEDGSLLLWGMKQSVFRNWPRFDGFQKEIVVEMISLCIEKKLGYSLLNS